MRALFCHETRYAIRGDGTVLSAAHFSSDAWRRYRAEFDQLDVVGRAVRPGDQEAVVRSDAPGVEFHTLPDVNSPRRWISQRAAAKRQLVPLISRADALILRGITGLGSIAFSIAQQLNKPIALEMSGCPFDNSWNYGSLVGRIAAPARFLVGRRIAARADFTIYVTSRFLQQRYPSNGYTANASNVELSAPEQDPLQLRSDRIRQRPTPLRIGLIGKVDHKLKGIQTAIRALAERVGDLPPFEFHILGDGSPARWQALAERLGIEESLFFDGLRAPGGPVLEWLDEIDLYLQPSFHEGLPRATIEAMSRGCAVIGSTAGGIPELLQPEWLHRPGDATTLGEKIVRLANSEALRRKEGERNFHHSKQYSASALRPIRADFWRRFSAFVQSEADAAK